MKHLFKTMLFALSMLSVQVAEAEGAYIAKQDPALLRQAVEQFLQSRSVGLPGRVEITIGKIDPRLNLAECLSTDAFLPPNSRVWGKTTVGVRCAAPTAWTIYVQANVSVFGDYFAAAVPLAQGQIVDQNSLLKMQGDLTTLPPGIITEASQAIGRSVAMSIQSGAPLRVDGLRAQVAVQQGQMIRLVSGGAGFRVSAEAKAITSANAGQLVQVRTGAGQIISGVAKMGGLVEVSF